MVSRDKKTTDWKKISIIGLSSFMGLIVLGSLGLWIFFAMTFATYDNLSDGFRMVYPKQWKLVEHPQPGAIAAFVSPKAGPLDVFQENVNISMTDLSKSPMTLEQYVNTVQVQMTGVFRNIAVQESAPVLLSGHEGHKFVFFAQGDAATVVVVYAFIYRDVAYNVTYIGAAVQYPRDKSFLDIMMNSFKVYF